MKKLLSVLLAVLMVLGTVTCLFTMPVTAETTEETPTAEQTVETLPENIIENPTYSGTVTSETNLVHTWSGNSVEFGTAAKFSIKWNSVSCLKPAVYHQLDFTVTTSETITDGAYLFPTIYCNNSAKTISEIVGVCTVSEQGSSAIDGLTALNHRISTLNINSTLTAGTDVVKLEGNKTYKFTYVFKMNPGNNNSNIIVVRLNGLGDGDQVTISNPNLFDLAGTDWDNFVYAPTSVVRYMVEEDGKVFQRMYGYRTVDKNSTIAAASNTVSAKDGGDYYGILLEGGKTYNTTFDMRLTNTAYDFKANSRFLPSFNWYEYGTLDYTEDYAAIKAEANTTDDDNKFESRQADVKNDDGTITQKGTEGVVKYSTGSAAYSEANNPYAYFYTSARGNDSDKDGNLKTGYSYTFNRRITSQNIANIVYKDAEGSEVSTGSGTTSGIGRDLHQDFPSTSNNVWFDANYSLYALGAQTAKEAAANAKSYRPNYYKGFRYILDDNGNWKINNEYGKTDQFAYSNAGNLVVPAKQDVNVAFAITYIYSGLIYDFDDFAVAWDRELEVELRNYKGEVVETADTVVPEASLKFDTLSNVYTANIDVPDTVDRDVYSFAWYDGDKLVSTDDTFVFSGDEVNIDNLKPVMTSRNILTNAGGFETYANGINLEAPFTYINEANYPNYTGPSAAKNRFYNQVPSTGDLWTGWDGNMKLSSLKDSDNGETIQKIKDDIAAAGGKITTSGLTGFTWFEKFPTITQATTTKTFKDGGKAWVDEAAHPVAPYSGTKMLRFQASTRTGYRAIEGLTLGKKYTLSFYAYNSYEYVFLKDVAIKTAPYYVATTNANDAKILAYYQTPCVTVDEDTHDKSGNVTGKPEERTKANVDYVGKWYKIELSFTAEQETVYLAAYNQTGNYTDGFTFIDELAVTEFDCKGNHTYDDIADDECNDCGEARVYPTAWDFEDSNTDCIGMNAPSNVTVVDAVDQPAKIGNKYLQYTSKGFEGLAFNFKYNSEDTYVISYDVKIFKYGDEGTVNGIDSYIGIYDDGIYSNGTVLNTGTDYLVTRYYEDGTPYDSKTFTQSSRNFYGRSETTVDGETVYGKFDTYGGDIWDEWQHFEITIDPDGNDYVGMVEYDFRPNGGGWNVGIDNFKVTVIESENVKAADEATDSTNFYNIRTAGVQGLRFKSDIDLNFLDNLGNGAKVVEYGTLATKASNVSISNLGLRLTREVAKDKNPNSKIVVGVAYSRDSGKDVRYAYDDETKKLTYTGVLTNISEKNYKTNYAVRGYVIIEDKDGNRFTVYDDVVELSVYDAADYIVKNSKDTNDIDAAQSVLDKYAEWEAAQQAA